MDRSLDKYAHPNSTTVVKKKIIDTLYIQTFFVSDLTLHVDLIRLDPVC